MDYRKVLIFLVYILQVFVFSAQDLSNLPKPPDGFKWNYLEEIKGKFLVPDNWFLNYEKKENTHAYFITKEDYKKEGIYKTGISINVITKLKKTNSFEYIKLFKDQIKKNAEVTGESDLIKFGPFRQYIIRYKSFSKELNKTIIIHQILISNIKTNTMYFILFETPEDEWEINWKIGEKILDLFGIDDEI